MQLHVDGDPTPVHDTNLPAEACPDRDRHDYDGACRGAICQATHYTTCEGCGLQSIPVIGDGAPEFHDECEPPCENCDGAGVLAGDLCGACLGTEDRLVAIPIGVLDALLAAAEEGKTSAEGFYETVSRDRELAGIASERVDRARYSIRAVEDLLDRREPI